MLGDEHPNTLISMSNLSVVWKGQGRDEEATELMERCLQQKLMTLGTGHPDTLSAQHCLDSWKLEGAA